MSLFILAAAMAAEAPAKPTLPEAPAATQAVDGARLAAAQRLLDAMDYDQMMARLTDAMVAQIGPATKALLESETEEPIDEELIRRIAAVQEKYLRARLAGDDGMRRVIAHLYALYYSAPELDRLAEIHADPAMRKFNEVAPKLMADMLPLIARINAQDRETLKAEIEAAVADYRAEQQAADGS